MENAVLIQRIRKPGQTIELDLNIPGHKEWFMHLYGGEKNLKEMMPQYSAIIEKKLAERKPLRGVEVGNDFHADADIQGISWHKDTNRLVVQAITTLPNKAMFIDSCLEVRTAAGESIAGYSQSDENTCHVDIAFNTIYVPGEYESETLEIDYIANWVDAATGELRTFLSSKDVHREMTPNYDVKNIEIKAPVKKNKDRPAPINIVYNRNFINPKDVDYNRPSTFNPNTGKQLLVAPFGAEVHFLDADDVFKEIEISTFSLKMDCQHGSAPYMLVYKEDDKEHDRSMVVKSHFKPTEDGFEFLLGEDWKNDVPAGSWPIRDRIDYFFTVDYILESGKRGTIQIGSALIEPIVSGQQKGFYLNLIWGCLAKGTHILMADGSEKCIEEIRMGERVKSAGGKVSIVTNIITGVESEPMVVIQTLGGHTLKCSRLHPIVTNQGVVRAEYVQGDYRLEALKGEVGIIGIWDEQLPSTEVYNLELTPEDGSSCDDGMTMYAEHLCVGDNRMQNANLKKEAKRELEMQQQTNVFTKELEKLKEWRINNL